MLINLRNAMMTGKRLPYDAEVEYLESTGTQWIDTGITPDSSTVAHIDLLYPSSAASHGYFGARIESGDRFQLVDSIGLGGGYFYSSEYPKTNARMQIDLNGQGIMYLNGVRKYATRGTFSAIASIPYTICLFGANQGGRTIFLNACKIFSCKLEKSGVLVRDFIPVRFMNEQEDNEGALYDRVSGQLFRNQGNGTFVIGPDASATRGGGYKRQCVRRSYRRSSRPSARFWQRDLWKEVA